MVDDSGPEEIEEQRTDAQIGMHSPGLGGDPDRRIGTVECDGCGHSNTFGEEQKGRPYCQNPGERRHLLHDQPAGTD